MSDIFDARDHYWIVADRADAIWSSKAVAFVTAEMSEYLLWQDEGARATPIATTIDLVRVLKAFGVPFGMLDLVAYAADKRWQKEIGGITVASVPIATDDRSKLMITGARVAAAADPGWTTMWIGSDGNAYPLNVAAMVAVSNAVADHVNACFATYATVAAAVTVGTITTTAEIDAAFA